MKYAEEKHISDWKPLKEMMQLGVERKLYDEWCCYDKQLSVFKLIFIFPDNTCDCKACMSIRLCE